MPLFTTDVLQLIATPSNIDERTRILDRLLAADRTGDVQRTLSDIEVDLFKKVQREKIDRLNEPQQATGRDTPPRWKNLFRSSRSRHHDTDPDIRDTIIDLHRQPDYMNPWMDDTSIIDHRFRFNGVFCRYRPLDTTGTFPVRLSTSDTGDTNGTNNMVFVTLRDHLLRNDLLPVMLYTGLNTAEHPATDKPVLIFTPDAWTILREKTPDHLLYHYYDNSQVRRLVGPMIDRLIADGARHGIICNDDGTPDDRPYMDHWLPWQFNPTAVTMANDLLHLLRYGRRKNIMSLTDTRENRCRVTDLTLARDLRSLNDIRRELGDTVADELLDRILDTFNNLPDSTSTEKTPSVAADSPVADTIARLDARARAEDIRSRYTEHTK